MMKSIFPDGLITLLTVASMHNAFHIPIVGRAFDQNGHVFDYMYVERWDFGCIHCINHLTNLEFDFV